VPEFVREEALKPADTAFDVADSDLDNLWAGLDRFKEPEKIWETRFPAFPQILFGAGVLKRLGPAASWLKMRKALLIVDPIMEELGYAGRVHDYLKRAQIESVLFADVEPDPPVREIDRIAAIYKENECDGLVALGGGSSMDAAKATALRVSQSGILEEYGSMVGGAGKIKPPLPPVVCIPTTSGTGSEVNSYSVITDEETRHKFIIMSDLLVPKLAVIDPLLMKTMPPALTAMTGVDALAHCVEGYVGMAIPYHPYYEALALYGVKLIGRSLRKAFSDGEDVDARTDMCLAAMYGGTSFTKGLGLGHAIGHVLGGLYHIPHGKAVGASLLCFVDAYREVCKKGFSDLAWALDGSDDLLDALIRLYRDLDMPLRFRDLEIPEADLKNIAFETSMDVPNMLGNPVPPKKGQVLELLRKFY
jgi:alcohol dehydrogenase class IV